MKRFFVRRLALTAALVVGACSDSSDPVNPDPGSITDSGAAAMEAVAGNGQSAGVGTAVAVAPTVVVKDSKGAPVGGVVVTFTPMAGGSVQNSSVVTGVDGIASAGQWTLGSTRGSQVLEAKTGRLTVRFTATAVDNFSIVVRYVGTPSLRQRMAVTNAVERWQTVVTRDLVNIPVDAAAGACFPAQPALKETVDDLLIFVEFVEIDGVGSVLGQAGPCFVRSDNLLPVVGYLKLDVADLDQMAVRGTLDDVVLHEIGHVLGFGTIWQEKKVLSGGGTADPRFTGGAALAAYRALGGTDEWVPVENTGADGTRDGHWRESVFGSELMTGFIGSTPNPLSALTIGSMTDIGYGTNPGAASSYTISTFTGGAVLEISKHERLTKPRFKIDRQGRKTKIATD